MPQQPTEVSIVSGYFNPLHVGHLDMMEAARSLTGNLVVIVNNDAQQVLKKGKVIQTLEDRLRIVRALRVVDDALGAVDQDATVRETLRLVRERYPDAALIFANGGDRSQRSAVAESDVCEALGINLRFAVGGETKADSSSRINASQGLESAPPTGLNRSRPGPPLWQSAGVPAWSLRPATVADVPFLRGVVIAATRLVDSPDCLEVAGLQLLPPAQSRGIGTAVMLRLAADAAPRPLTLGVEKDNPRARALYERRGFVPDGETETEYRLRRGAIA